MRLWARVAIGPFALLPMAVHAAVTPIDLQIAARALGFMEKPMSGNVRLGIIYDPGAPQSRAGADAIVRLLGDGLKAGAVVFLPVLTNIDQAMTAPVDALFLPDEVADPTMKVAKATASRKMPCITLNITQVQNGDCVLGVSVDPKVQIYLNRASAADSGTTFVSVFRMMVTEF